MSDCLRDPHDPCCLATAMPPRRDTGPSRPPVGAVVRAPQRSPSASVSSPRGGAHTLVPARPTRAKPVPRSWSTWTRHLLSALACAAALAAVGQAVAAGIPGRFGNQIHDVARLGCDDAQTCESSLEVNAGKGGVLCLELSLRGTGHGRRVA